MEYKKHISIRITDDQMKRLMLSIAKDKQTLSELIRDLLQQFIDKDPHSISSIRK